MSDVDQRLGSRYILKERLGRGAMGTVWRAVNTDTNTDVAVKVLSEELSDEPDMIARFIQERNTLMTVQHPNLVRIHDMVVEDSRLAIVMDLVRGPDLHRHMVERGSLSLGEVAVVGRGVADALAAIHAAGIIHRDLKPANILLELSGPQPEPRLVDFGIARMLDGTRLTARSSVVGTPEYLSPEAISGGEATPAIDVYAFGIAVYELLTGRTPFHGDQLLQVLNQHMYQEPPWPQSIPQQILPLLQAMLTKDPRYRPTAQDVSATMSALAASAPANAAPVPQQPVAQAPQSWQVPPPSPSPAEQPRAPYPQQPEPQQQSPYNSPPQSPLLGQYGPQSPVPTPPGTPMPTGTPMPGGPQSPIPNPSPSGFFYPGADMFDAKSPASNYTPSPPPFTDDMFTPKKPQRGRRKGLLITAAVAAVLAVGGGVFALVSTGGGNKPVAQPTSAHSVSPAKLGCPAQSGPSATARWTLAGTAADCASSGTDKLALANGAVFGTQSERGKVLTFSGGYASATVPLSGVVDTSSSFSVSIWVRLSSYDKAQYATVLSFLGQSQAAFELQYNPGWGGWAFNHSSADSLSAHWVAAAGNVAPRKLTWTHLVGVYDASAKTLSLFVDGKAVSSRTGIAGWKASGKLSVGANLNSGGAAYQGMTGEVSDLEIFSSALTTQQVAALS